MEVYTNSAERAVVLNSPVDPVPSSLEVTLTDDLGNLLYSFPTASVIENDQYSVTVPFAYVGSERLMIVKWSFDYVENGETFSTVMQTPFNVVQPILPLSEVKSIIDSTSDEDAIKAERSVRHIVYAHTGQAFGLFVGAKKVTGTANNSIQLPYRLLEIEKVNGLVVNKAMYSISRSGWYISTPDLGIPNVKADYYGLHMINGVVENPNNVSYFGFRKNWEYVIEGKWGWYEIPESVKEAARILVHDYWCQDSVYRDRYLNSVSATDWRLEFNSGAFLYTGNVRADQLLSNYTLKRGWAVV